jgi:hypothetical protein
VPALNPIGGQRLDSWFQPLPPLNDQDPDKREETRKKSCRSFRHREFANGNEYCRQNARPKEIAKSVASPRSGFRFASNVVAAKEIKFSKSRRKNTGY